MTYVAVSTTRDDLTGEVIKTEVVYTVKGTPPANYSLAWRSGDGVQAGDMRSSLAGKGLLFTPAIGDRVEFDSTVWRIVTVSPVFSGESTVLWTLQLRR
jgi:hypothetical protein